MNIEYRDASYSTQPYARRRVRRTEARWGDISAHGANRTEAKANLLAAVERQLAHLYTRRYLCAEGVTMCLYYRAGWCYDIITPDHEHTSSCMLGTENFQEAMDSMRSHFSQYVQGIEIARGVDRTNGELDAAVLAYRADPSEENRERCLRAQEAHNDAFLADQANECVLRVTS